MSRPTPWSIGTLTGCWLLSLGGTGWAQPPATAGRSQPQAAASQAAASQAAGRPAIPEILATVDGQPIDRASLGREAVRRFGDQVLENLTNKHLILQACQAHGMQISKQEVDEEIERIANKFRLNTKLYLRLLEEERGISAEQYASDVVWPMLALRKLSEDKIRVTTEEVDQRFQAEYGPKVQVRMIAVSQRDQAGQLRELVLAEPDSFAQLAKKHSEDPASASVDGLLPPIRRFSGDDELEQIAFQLKPGQVSDVFRIGPMYVLLQCVRHLPAELPAPELIPAIQAGFRSEIYDVKLKDMAEELFATLREKSQIQLVWGNPQLQAEQPGVAAIINGQRVSVEQLQEECLVRFGRQVLEGEINRRILQNALAAAKLEVEQADIDAEIARAAEYYGFMSRNDSPDVERWLKTVLEGDKIPLDLYVQDAVWPTVALKKLVSQQVEVTEDDLRQGFISHHGPRAEVLAIVLSNQRVAQEVWNKARANQGQEQFGELASRYSVEPTSRSNFGKVPPLRQHGGQPTLEKVAFGMQPGEMSGIIEVNGQYVILLLQGFTEPLVSDFEAVREELYKDLLETKLRKAMNQRLEGLMGNAQIDNFLTGTSQMGAAAMQASRRALQGR